jgi:hypothetical protein
LAFVLVNNVVDPIQTPFAPAIAGTTGNGFTTTVALPDKSAAAQYAPCKLAMV